MKIILAGSEGFLGNNFKTQFSEHEIDTIDKQSVGITTWYGDLTHARAWPRLSKDYDAVVCLASEPNVWERRSPVPPHHESLIVQNAFDFAWRNKIPKLIHLSSSNVYGVKTSAFEEDDLCLPINDYGRQKLMAELVLKYAATGQDRVTAVDIRMFNAIGSWQRATMFPFLIVSHALEGRELPLYGERYRAWTPVRDLMDFLGLVLDDTRLAPGYHVFNYGNNQTWSQSDLLRLFEWQGIRPKTRLLPERSIEVPQTLASMKKTCATFGNVLPSNDLTHSVTAVIDYVRSLYL